MSLGTSLVLIALLIATSAFLSVAEIALAASGRLRLKRLADAGDARAAQVLAVQQQPGRYFAVVQIGQNMVAILGGVVGEGALTPGFAAALAPLLGPQAAQTVGFLLSFATITSLFVLLADLFPKRLALVHPEPIAVRIVGPMRGLAVLLAPVVWLFNALTRGLFRVLGVNEQRDERVTPDDILALAAAGAEAGVLRPPEHELIENVLELDTRNVESAMTPRERIVYLLQDEDEAQIRARIAAAPHSTYVVCDGHVDRVVGFVDAADLFARVLQQRPIALRGEAAEGLLQKVLVVPDRLSLAEMLAQFRQAHEDFAVIVNEYSLVVGVITLNDVMSTVMGSLVPAHDEEQIVRRDDGSWLMDGLTPIVDVLRALDIDPGRLPHRGQYDTLAGFLMMLLRRIPKRTDGVVWHGHRFEVMDVDNLRIDQVMVTPLAAADAAAAPAAPG